ncbi:alpha/beta hydrolase [Phenylobacterium sp.]|jgi:pimeloyl-ACP methyl ester carboxylesterase|uniref:alpha/beta fold hydrolase n=1 Tax=Phenylobacterium sp. TaxID=1871053 RepID=UPI002E348C46|nr:alpha/beta hydrolase [Phenylobacterium sp.]HEX2559640.1 alpha/beta hydrolase [Phenylobacterium sp.]
MLKPIDLWFALALGAAAVAAPPAAQAAEPQAPAAAAPLAAKRSAVAQVAGLKVRYDVHGDLKSGKTPLLVLHGAYMSADAMAPMVQRFSRTRPVIVLDQRGHGRTGDGTGPITYERLADDAAAVLDAAGVRQADVFGYSMGGAAAIQLAVRHPGKVGKLVAVSASTRLDAMYPEVLAGIAQITPEVFANTPMRREYDRLAPRPQDFPKLVEKLKVLDATPFDWGPAMRALTHKTMIVMGDYDVVAPEHAVEMFRMRGGGAPALAAQGFLTAPPPARLLVLPGASHIGIMAEPDILAALVTPFLEDATPKMPEGFF